jgi:FixJ family two-component response regulator
MAAQSTVEIVVDDDAGLLKAVARLLAHNSIQSRTFASAEALIESGSTQTATCLRVAQLASSPTSYVS